MKWSAALLFVAVIAAFLVPALWPIVILGFFQNLSGTFVSRGRNSGSLRYHLAASLFSNGVYVAALVTSIGIVTAAGQSLVAFGVAYTAATVSGSIMAHAMAMKFERGTARNIQADAHAELEKRVKKLEVLWSR